MAKIYPFIRFEDFNKSEGVPQSYGSLDTYLAKTKRQITIENQLDNPVIDFPFGTFLNTDLEITSRFANDRDMFGADKPFQLANHDELTALRSIEKRVIDLLKGVINYAQDGRTFGEFSDFVTSKTIGGYVFNMNYFTDDAFEVYAVPDDTSKNRTFSLCAVADYLNENWKFQWFISTVGDTGLTSLFDEYVYKVLPLAFDTNQVNFQDVFYDLDFVCFPPEMPLPEGYPIPVKSNDLFRFNIPDTLNIPETDTVGIGMVVDGSTLLLGLAPIAPCKLDSNFLVTIPAADDEEFQTTLEDIEIEAFDCNGSSLGIIITIESADLFRGGTYAQFAQSVVDNIELNAGYLADYEFDVDGNLILTVTDENVETLIVRVTISEGAFSWEGDTTVRCPAYTQRFAEITFPPNMEQGCFTIFIYNTETDQVYAFSNPLKANDYEHFSQILIYQGVGITESLEYPENWNQRIRIGLNGGSGQPQLTESLYRQTSGNHIRSVSKSDKKLFLQSDYFDQATVDAMFSATRHPVFVLAFQSLFINGDVEASHDQDFSNQTSYFNLQQMKFEALIQKYQPYTNGCINC